MIGPPPRPWKMRAMISVVRLGAAPDRNELTTNSVLQSRKKRLRPRRPASQPVAGITTALAARYEVMTHETSSRPADSEPCRCGRITLVTLVSRICMKATTITVSVIAHFCVGDTDGASGVATDAVMIGSPWCDRIAPTSPQEGSMKAAVFHGAHKPLTIENVDIDRPLGREVLVRTVACGVTTGVGAVFNTARIEPGSTVAVFGAGGVGLAAIQGARIAGARMIIAVDTVESKFAKARELGATHTVNAKTDDPVKAIRTLTNGGVDYSFEAIGLKIAAEQCFDCIRPGGTATIIGMIPVGQKIELDGPMFLREKKIQGCSMGSNRFKVDMPRYIAFYRQARLKLDEMVSRRGRLEDVNEAFRAMKAGEVARTVLMFD